MSSKLNNIKWQIFEKKKRLQLIHGLKKGYIVPYDDETIEKFRKVYYGGIPASIILLSNGLTNGYCYDRALLLARVFLDGEDDINLIYASVDSLRLNPEFMSDSPTYADHCIVERITKDGHYLIYDTSAGFVYDKEYYWRMENPKVRHINDKESIRKFVEEDYQSDFNNDKYVAPIVLDLIKNTFGRPNEMYTLTGIELLQREIEHYKGLIKYDELVKEINEDMKNRRRIKR